MGQANCRHGSRDHPEPQQQSLPGTAPPEPLHRQRVKVTQGRRTRKRDLLLFSDTLVIAKAKRASHPRPQLCLALAALQVLSSGKGAGGDGPPQEEGKDARSLILLWPSGSCVVTFCSRVVKELWVSALLGPPGGAQGARLTRLPSIKLLRKELRRRQAATTLHASSLQRLVERQAEAAAQQNPPPVPSAGHAALAHTAAGGTSRSSSSSWRRYLPWPFARRGTSTAAAAPSSSSGSGRSGLLFGRPLAELCSQDGTLPHTIQDLLSLLHRHGPSTEGIFRLAAGEQASRQLREALDTGAEVHLESQPAHLLAVILKDFLRKIPSKLLQAPLYQEWMSALQKDSTLEKVAALKEVASKLPKGNLVLLKELLALLQRISSKGATSRMSAHNLAICVGPNLLSPPDEHTLPLDVLVEVTQKVTQLAEFLIQHRGELFEEEEEDLAVARTSGEESATREMPPAAPESEHLHKLSKERRLPGSSCASRKRKTTCEEERDGQPESKKRRLEGELSGVGNRGNPSGQGEEGEQVCSRLCCPSCQALHTALRSGSVSQGDRDGPREEACTTCPWHIVDSRRNIPLQPRQLSFVLLSWISSKGQGGMLLLRFWKGASHSSSRVPCTARLLAKGAVLVPLHLPCPEGIAPLGKGTDQHHSPCSHGASLLCQELPLCSWTSQSTGDKVTPLPPPRFHQRFLPLSVLLGAHLIVLLGFPGALTPALGPSCSPSTTWAEERREAQLPFCSPLQISLGHHHRAVDFPHCNLAEDHSPNQQHHVHQVYQVILKAPLEGS